MAALNGQVRVCRTLVKVGLTLILGDSFTIFSCIEGRLIWQISDYISKIVEQITFRKVFCGCSVSDSVEDIVHGVDGHVVISIYLEVSI